LPSNEKERNLAPFRKKVALKKRREKSRVVANLANLRRLRKLGWEFRPWFLLSRRLLALRPWRRAIFEFGELGVERFFELWRQNFAITSVRSTTNAS